MSLGSKPLIILIAGPYRSGTHDAPDRMAANLHALERYALPLYKAGHLPMIGEWVALPIIRAASSASVGVPVYQQYLYPVASRLLERCDAVLRVLGESKRRRPGRGTCAGTRSASLFQIGRGAWGRRRISDGAMISDRPESDRRSNCAAERTAFLSGFYPRSCMGTVA